ncbi:flagellar basal body-associated FliL family protein [Gracilibacillus phocaeensis]|uniref:flagellar basal body-associated FliL family protein n=1 Tax=Gracilibacillus phocaeensis TaxID=2042304 RepID=UPI00103010D7|nr:flagellar basal body-associated FliL family protein [Gracilibacillus phocaeensis]
MSPKIIKTLVAMLLVITIAGVVAIFFVLNKESDTGKAMNIDDMVENSYTTEEIRTDLPDGNFVLIQFQFITDTRDGLEEIEKREFQIKNEFIKLAVNMTAEDFKHNLAEVESEMKTAMNTHMEEGNIVEVLVINKVIQ